MNNPLIRDKGPSREASLISELQEICNVKDIGLSVMRGKLVESNLDNANLQKVLNDLRSATFQKEKEMQAVIEGLRQELRDIADSKDN